MSDINQTLKSRGDRYGPFENHAHIAQEMKRTVNSHLAPKVFNLASEGVITMPEADAILECVDMVCHKLARIANGDPLYIDSWHDIIGYVTLVENTLKAKGLPQ